MFGLVQRYKLSNLAVLFSNLKRCKFKSKYLTLRAHLTYCDFRLLCCKTKDLLQFSWGVLLLPSCVNTSFHVYTYILGTNKASPEQNGSLCPPTMQHRGESMRQGLNHTPVSATRGLGGKGGCIGSIVQCYYPALCGISVVFQCKKPASYRASGQQGYLGGAQILEDRRRIMSEGNGSSARSVGE